MCHHSHLFIGDTKENDIFFGRYISTLITDMFCIHYRCTCTIWRKYMLIRIQNSLSDEWFPAMYPLCTMICIKTETWAQRNWEYILPVSHVHTFSHNFNFLAYVVAYTYVFCAITIFVQKKRTFSFSGHGCNKNWKPVYVGIHIIWFFDLFLLFFHSSTVPTNRWIQWSGDLRFMGNLPW